MTPQVSATPQGSWIREDNRTWIQKLSANVLSKGPLPRHVGFILDGNRRFAVKSSVPKIQGHIKGFEKLAETLRWCLDLGITEVTVFVFSIENFKRPKEEVDGLMRLAKDKFLQLLTEEQKLMEAGVCIQVVGDWSLVPKDLRAIMAKAMILTRYNTKAKLNVAFAYTSRNEITRGVQCVQQGVLDGDLLVDDLNEDLLSKTFQIMPTLPLDLLVRTSGETRLSDFLLWQSSESVLCFTKVLWPEFTYWHLLGALCQFQVNYLAILQIPKKDTAPANPAADARREKFVEKLYARKWAELTEDASSIPDNIIV